MVRIRQDLYRDPSRIRNAYEIGALEIAGDKWKPSQTYFQNHPRFRPVDSVASWKQKLTEDFMNDFKDLHQPVFTKYSAIIFQALEALVSTLRTIAAFRSLGLNQNCRLGDRWQPTTIGGNCRPTDSSGIYSRTCGTYSWIHLLCSEYKHLVRGSKSFFVAIFDLPQPILLMRLGYQLWNFSAVVSQLLDPQWQNRLWFQSWRRPRNMQTARLTDPHAWLVCPIQDNNILPTLLEVWLEDMLHYFDSVHGRDKRWGLRSHLSPVSHLACLIPST